MLVDARGHMSAEAFAAKRMPTRINAGDRIHGHLIHAYTTLEQALGRLGELGALL
jgi:hypothetical protein